MNFWQFPEALHDNIAVIYQTESLTYLQLEQLVIEFMPRLPESRQLVALACNNDLDTLVAYLACLKKRVPMLLMDNNVDSNVDGDVNSHGDNQTVIDNRQQLFESFNVCAVICGRNIERLQSPLSEIDPRLAIMISTSGSTGSAKQVALSYDNLATNAQSICDYLPILKDDVVITTLPFQYSYGLSVINTHLLTGACILLSDNPVTSREFWNLLDEQKVSSFAGVPYTYEMLRRLGFLRKEFPFIRYLTQAGGRLSDESAKEFSAHLKSQDKQLYIMYGQTEATARMSWLMPEKLSEKPGSIGSAIPGGTFCLSGENSDRFAPGSKQPVLDEAVANETVIKETVIEETETVGELIYQGPNIMLGYASKAIDLARFTPVDWLHTGDIAKRDEDGDYFIVGRKKRFVKIFGSRINLDEVEKLLETQGYFAKVVGTDLRIYIALKEDGCGDDFGDSSNIKKSDIKNSDKINDDRNNDKKPDAIQYLAKTLRLHLSVMSLSYVEAFPLKTNQKIDYTRLLQFFEEQQHAR